MSTQEAPNQPGSFNDFYELHRELSEEDAIKAYTAMLLENYKASPGSRVSRDLSVSQWPSQEPRWLGHISLAVEMEGDESL